MSEAQDPGRPSIFSDEIASAICDRLMEGESLNSICSDDDMPKRSTVFSWLAGGEHPKFLDQYSRARSIQADGLVDDVLQIAEDTKGGDKDDISAARLRIDARFKMAALMAPKKYRPGVKSEVETSDALADKLAAALERVRG